MYHICELLQAAQLVCKQNIQRQALHHLHCCFELQILNMYLQKQIRRKKQYKRDKQELYRLMTIKRKSEKESHAMLNVQD